MKATLYARFSTSLQREQSLEDQLRVCERLTERHGFTVVAKFTDSAISGGTSQRPGYQRMLAAARRREFDIIVAEDTSRLWRNLAEQAPRLAELRDLGIAVVTHDLDTRHESSEILGAVNGAMSEQYRKEIGRRTRRGLEGNAINGKRTGGKAFGYQTVDGELQIVAAQAQIVLEIFCRYADGESALTIAADLNARRVPSPGATWKRELRRRGGWVASCINGDPKRGVGILNCELYAGRVVWNRSRWIRSAADSKKRRQVQNPKSAWIVREDESLRIVPQVLWDRVKARQARQAREFGARVARGMRRASAGPTGRQPAYLFSGLLVCGKCGSKFTIRNPRSYACSSWINGRACENRLQVRRDLVERLLLEQVKEDLSDPAIVDDVAREMRRRLKAERPKPDLARARQLDKEIDNLVSAIATGALRNSPALAARLAAAEAELAKLKEPAPDMAPIERLIPRIGDRYLQMVRELEKTAERDPQRARQALFQALEGAITLHPEDGVLVAEIAYSAPLPLVGNVAENMVAGARFREWRPTGSRSNFVNETRKGQVSEPT